MPKPYKKISSRKLQSSLTHWRPAQVEKFPFTNQQNRVLMTTENRKENRKLTVGSDSIVSFLVLIFTVHCEPQNIRLYLILEQFQVSLHNIQLLA